VAFDDELPGDAFFVAHVLLLSVCESRAVDFMGGTLNALARAFMVKIDHSIDQSGFGMTMGAPDVIENAPFPG
jgi:hypothetical protein